MRFASYPSVFIHDEPNGKKTEHLIWGDLIELKDGRQGDWIEVKGRNTTGWMREADAGAPQLLEVNVVDVGQGDGCFIVTPNNKFILVDAGERENMFNFLNWRFNLRAFPNQRVEIDSAVITHSDWDHSGGFSPFFEDERFRFNRVFHNGIVERPGTEPLGHVERDEQRSYLTGLVVDQATLDGIPTDGTSPRSFAYLRMLQGASKSGRLGSIGMLCSEDGYLPGYESDQPLAIQVLGPVPESTTHQRRLRWFSDEGKTKNGHSVILKLEYGVAKILLTGDLNIPAEEYLLEHYGHMNPSACSTLADQQRLVTTARTEFEVDVAKACHHGSADFTDLYLQALNPLVTVISSGDDEPYCHPRPEALGAFGKYGRGSRPLIFSTELARSTREETGAQSNLQEERGRLQAERASAVDKTVAEKLDQEIDTCSRKIERNVAVYGMINLRTDGQRVIMAQKLERPAANGDRWDIHKLESGPEGSLQYVPPP